MNTTDKPLAAKGLISYRYKGIFGYIMIGAKNNKDALNQANRSLSNEIATFRNLQIWNEQKNKYVQVNNND